jgi:hypothetical protein
MNTQVMAQVALQPVEAKRQNIKHRYMEALTLIERLHRRLLDVIKDDFERSGEKEVNPVQALLLFNISDAELTALTTSKSWLKQVMSTMSVQAPTSARCVSA